MDEMDVGQGEGNADHRLVHLDLKGAPPRMEYYEQIFPLLQKWGATGLLIEYEDMFPYRDSLAEIACGNAYSASDIDRLQLLAKQYNMMVIPLIQTFGHFEFVLKHDRWRHLREVPISPLTLCPLRKGSLTLVTHMIDQVLSLHPDISWFHIGADEVYHIGVCERCCKYMQEHGMSQQDMFFMHVSKVLKHLHSNHPGIQPIMWDDMLRKVELITIQNSGIGKLVEPMVWFYCKNFDLPPDLWERYSQVFDSMWVASAFKGATGPCMFATDIGYHVENHRGWLTLVQQDIRHKFKRFRGYAITGWSRYDHYAVLCETLPVGLPSLAVCLLMITHGAYTKDVHETATNDLNFAELIPLVPFNHIGVIYGCSFPGSRIYMGVQHLLKLKMDYKFLMNNDRLNGWMTPYHVKHNFTNPAHVEHFFGAAQAMLSAFQSFHTDMQSALLEVFYPDTVDEWLSVNVGPKLDRLGQIVEDAHRQMELGGRVKDYQLCEQQDQEEQAT